MSIITMPSPPVSPTQPSSSKNRSRGIRLWSGIILMVFVTSHFLNHALGIFGMQTMEAAQVWRYAIWHSVPATILLYGAFLVHPVFGMWRVAQRRTLRMPVRELLQITLGLAIPVLLIDHIAATRIMSSFFGFQDNYGAVLGHLWPARAWTQSLLLLIVWTHGIIGLHYTLQTKDWYEKWRDAALVAAFLVPILALAGFVVAGREAGMLEQPIIAFSQTQIDHLQNNIMMGKSAFTGVVIFFAALIALREIWLRTSKKITVRYTGHGLRRITPGLTLLDISRRSHIPHPSMCAGRARCATCRVLVLAGEDYLPAPGPNEEELLKKISAPAHVRLACQIRPTHDLQLQILLSADNPSIGIGDSSAVQGGAQVNATVLVADLRAFAALSRQQVPHELMTLISRMFDEMNQAINAHGGRMEAFYGDGLMAVFGLDDTMPNSSRAALAAAEDMLRAVDSLNREFASALPVPLRIGIGIHSGPVITGTIENAALGRRQITVGETVMLASQLEAATRYLLADIVVSDVTLKASGRKSAVSTFHSLPINGRTKAMAVHAIQISPATEDMADNEVENEAAPLTSEPLAAQSTPAA